MIEKVIYLTRGRQDTPLGPQMGSVSWIDRKIGICRTIYRWDHCPGQFQHIWPSSSCWRFAAYLLILLIIIIIILLITINFYLNIYTGTSWRVSVISATAKESFICLGKQDTGFIDCRHINCQMINCSFSNLLGLPLITVTGGVYLFLFKFFLF